MKEQFVTYEIALKLKELGFDEPCLAYFQKDLHVYSQVIMFDGINSPNLDVINSKITENHKLVYGIEVTAPLWQQAFDWLYDNKGLFVCIDFWEIEDEKTTWVYYINEKWSEGKDYFDYQPYNFKNIFHERGIESKLIAKENSIKKCLDYLNNIEL